MKNTKACPARPKPVAGQAHARPRAGVGLGPGRAGLSIFICLGYVSDIFEYYVCIFLYLLVFFTIVVVYVEFILGRASD